MIAYFQFRNALFIVLLKYSPLAQEPDIVEDYMEQLNFSDTESQELFETVMKLPEKYRTVIHLFYYEDYSIKEIADILKISESNVKVRLNRGRTVLRDTLKEAWDYEQSE